MDRDTRENVEATRSAIEYLIWLMEDTTRIGMELNSVSLAPTKPCNYLNILQAR
jgi:hypothetical protein